MHNRPLVRSREEFEARLEAGWDALGAAVDDVAREAEQVIGEYQRVRLILDSPMPPAFSGFAQDAKDQLVHLVFKGFLTVTPPQWRAHLPRYLAGIRARYAKLPGGGLERDARLTAEVAPYWRACKARLDLHAKAGVTDEALVHYRWMVEEFRVAQFAQELRTSVTVSPKRLQEQWERIGKP